MGPEALEMLDPSDSGFYLDGTVGGGGHTRLLLEACPECRVLAVDRDPEALLEARTALGTYRARVRFLAERFDRAPRDPEVRDRGLDGALLDLGVSSRQLDADDRGFTFRRGAPLDMRMGADTSIDARTVLAEAPEEELVRIFREYGEEPRARRRAREVVKRRRTAPLATSGDLVAALAGALGRAPSMKEKARIFQALRIAVNQELEALEQGLPAIRDVMNGGAVFVVIAYHSLEDRAVKNAFRDWSRACICPPEVPICVCRGEALGQTLTRKVVRPSEAEVSRNPRARSARLRAWRRAA
jgi:16S rRNA (cytosine1402-N4)-methyltransferase